MAQPFNAASIVTDGFDFEASYQFDLEDYDVPGAFVLRSLINHTSKYILDTGVVGTADQTLAVMADLNSSEFRESALANLQ